jgi:hypothetical protein
MLINQWLFPRSKPLHDAHLLFSLGCEAGDFLILNDRLACSGVEKASEYGWAVAAMSWLATDTKKAMTSKNDTHTAETTPPSSQTLAAIFFRFSAWG